jgi:hypothetical protein
MKKISFILAVFLLCGCSVKKIAVKNMADIMTDGMGAYLEEEDIKTAQDTMLCSVKMAESMLKTDPENQKLLELTAKGYCGYSFAFLEDENPARASAMYKKGMSYSTRLLELKNIILQEKFNGEKLKVKDTPALFWHSFCMGGFIKLNLDDPFALSQINKLETMIDKLIVLNPQYYYNSAYALKGSLLARSKILGGNLAEAKRNFEMSLKGQGVDFKINKLLYAKTYGEAVLDKNLFERLLQEVLQEPDNLPQEKLLNNIAKQKAQKLLEQADEIF